MERIPTLAAVIALSGLLGCFENPRCNDDVRKRLLEDCKLSFSPTTTLLCGPFIGSREADEARFDEYHERICRIVDPGGDTDCLRTATCAQLEAGACFDDENFDQRDDACVGVCEDAALACYKSCDPSEPYEACADCGVNCIDRRQRCLDRC